MFGLFSQTSSTQISAQEVAQQLKASPGPFVLDVREPGEYQQGRIPGSVLIPLGTLSGRLNELPTGQPIVVVCRSGNRSGVGTRILRQAGLDALNMAGGMNAWRGPVER
ncbi:MAG: rhodanese-like domain-containing protein [Candidatus Sericytochromatia bacterium]